MSYRVHFDDRDWKAAIKRYKEKNELPKDKIIESLSQIRLKQSQDDVNEIEAGPSFSKLINGYLEKDHLTILSHKDSNQCHTLRDLIVIQRRFTVRQVIEAFLSKACLTQQVLGCFTEIYLKRALERADELDKELKNNPNGNFGKLFGVPISIKGHLGYKNSKFDRGFVFDIIEKSSIETILKEQKNLSKENRINSISDSTIEQLENQIKFNENQNCHVIELLLNQGAIILAKTTMPQSIMQLDTKSNLYGQTLNPWNLHVSPGGSSGGEAASIASLTTIAGIGTDIGGSVRQPASCCGLYGIRCTVGRINSSGSHVTMPGNEGILGTFGPLCRSLKDLELLLSIITKDSNKTDPFLCPPLEWNELRIQKDFKNQKPIKIGVIYHDNYVRPITPIKRILKSTIEKLESSSKIEIIKIDLKDFGKIASLLARELYFMEGGELLQSFASITGENLLPLTKMVFEFPVKNHNSMEIWNLQLKRESFKRNFFKEIFQKNNLDILICPTSALTAPKFQKIHYWGYTSLFNLLDLPGISFPIKNARVDDLIDIEFEKQEESKEEENRYLSEIEELTHKEYKNNRKIFNNCPIGLQLIGKRFKEEELLNYLNEIEKILDQSNHICEYN